jgi:hypothetical protein
MAIIAKRRTEEAMTTRADEAIVALAKAQMRASLGSLTLTALGSGDVVSIMAQGRPLCPCGEANPPAQAPNAIRMSPPFHHAKKVELQAPSSHCSSRFAPFANAIECIHLTYGGSKVPRPGEPKAP